MEVGNNNEPLCGTAGFVYTGSLWVPQSSDADGVTKVTSISGLAQQAQNEGYYSDAWQKDPIRLGYSDTVDEAKSDTNLGAGTNNLDSTPVPSGEIWIITNVIIRIASTTITRLIPSFEKSGESYPLDDIITPTANIWLPYSLYTILNEEDLIRVSCYNASAGDDMYLSYMGFKIDLDL